ncbi:hypothetical protein QUC31_006002, partial [Theobroma cacao]
ILERL